MKSAIYLIIAFGCAWIIFEPKNEYVAPTIPEGNLFYYNTQLPAENPQIDSVIKDIEANLEYLQNQELTQN